MRPIFAVMVVSGLLASVQVAEACSCIAPGAACQEYWRVPAVFLGRVDSIAAAPVKSGALPLTRRVMFTVLEAYRGVSPGEIEVRTGGGGGDCGYNFIEGGEYLVYAYRSESAGVLTTGICSRTRRAADAGEDLAYARALASGAASPSRISGTVKLADRSLARQRVREPVAMSGVTVRLEKEGSTIDVATDAQGKFAASDVAPGTYTVSVDLTPQYYAEVFPRAVELLDDKACADVNVTVRYDGHVAGRIVDAAGRPVAGVTIELTVSTGIDQQPGPERIRVLSDRSGRYELTRVPPGTFVVGINTLRNRDGGLPQPRVFHPGVDAIGSASRVPLTGGERVTLQDFVLPAQVTYTTIEGIVLNPDGAPAEGAKVYLKGPSEIDYILSEPAVTDRDGRFVLAAISGQAYRLFAERPRGQGQGYRLDSSEQVAFEARSDLSPFKLLLRRRY